MIPCMRDFCAVRIPIMCYIHDGARPFVTEEMIERGYEAVKRTGACVMGMPSKDTVKLADEAWLY